MTFQKLGLLAIITVGTITAASAQSPPPVPAGPLTVCAFFPCQEVYYEDNDINTDSNWMYKAFTTQPANPSDPADAAFASMHIHMDSQQGGLNQNGNAGGIKSNYIPLFVTANHTTIGQHWGTESEISCMALGDCIATAGQVWTQGGFAAGGDEQTEGLREEIDQDPTPPTASVYSTSANTLTLSSPVTPGKFGEWRSLIDTNNPYTTGSIAGLVTIDSSSGASTTVTAYSSTGTIVTVTAGNGFVAGQYVTFATPSGALSPLNGQTLAVVGTGATSFTVDTTAISSGSGSASGTINPEVSYADCTGNGLANTGNFCVVAQGSGTSWLSQFPAGKSVALSLGWLANGSTKFVLMCQMFDGQDCFVYTPLGGALGTTLLMDTNGLGFAGPTAPAPWEVGWGTSGSYAMYKASLVTQVGVGGTTLTVQDGTRFTTSSSLEEELPYNMQITGARIVLNQAVGVPDAKSNGAVEGCCVAAAFGTGLGIYDVGNSSEPGYQAGIDIEGNFQRAIEVQGNNGGYGDAILLDTGPGPLGYIINDLASNTGTLGVFSLGNSVGTQRTITYTGSTDNWCWGATSGTCLNLGTNAFNQVVATNYGEFGDSNALGDQTQVRAIGSYGSYAAGYSFTSVGTNARATLTMTDSNGDLAISACSTASCTPGSTGVAFGSTGQVQAVQLTQNADNDYAGECAISNTTNCTFTIAKSYQSTPLCFASLQSGASASAQCDVSGTTVTITANGTTTGTWGALIIGYPY